MADQAQTKVQTIRSPLLFTVRQLFSQYAELGKIKLSGLILATTAVGFALADASYFQIELFVWTMLGTACTCLGANSYNEWWEHRRDARMQRTKNRPIPSGRMTVQHAFAWATCISVLGVLMLLIYVNALTAFLAFLNIALYVLVYTPLKPRSSLCTLVGAVCGAIPPMMGWTAVTNSVGYGAWVLAAILFIWQIPHFMALAWFYRVDYERGGFRMLPTIDPTGRLTGQIMILYSVLLVPIGMAFYAGDLTGLTFVVSSFVLGSVFLYLSMKFYFNRTPINARKVFFASIIYLPLILGFMVADRSYHPWDDPRNAAVLLSMNEPATISVPPSPAR
jgi:heme o synthase